MDDRSRSQDRSEQNVQERNVSWYAVVVLRDDPKQVVSLTKAKSVPTNMREFLSWAQRHYRIDVTASTVERKTGGLASAGACPGGCKEFSRKGPNALPTRSTCKICGTVRKEERHPQ